MGHVARDYELPPGRYRIRILEPVIENGGVAREEWGEPAMATLREDSGMWVDGRTSPLCFDWKVVDVSGGDVPYVDWASHREGD